MINFFVKNRKTQIETVFNRIKRLNINSQYIKYLIPKLKGLLSHYNKQTISNYMWNHIASKNKKQNDSNKKLKNSEENQINPDSEDPRIVLKFSRPRSINPPTEFCSITHIKQFIFESSQKYFKEWFFQNIKNKINSSASNMPKRKTRRSTRLKKLHDL